MEKTLHIITTDDETRSEVNLLKSGAWAYAEHPSTEIICKAFKIGDQKTRIWVAPYFRQFAGAIEYVEELPVADFVAAEYIEAHNAGFEQALWAEIGELIYGWPPIPIEKWGCSAAKCAAHSLPRSMDGAGSALDSSIQKNKEGHRIMLKLCKPRKPTKNNPAKWHESPEDFQKLFTYCMRDVDTEYSISQMLPDLNRTEQELWFVDQEINQRGLYIDLQTVNTIIDLREHYSLSAIKELKDLTDSKVKTANELDKMKLWISEQGFDLPDLTKPTIKEALKRGDLTPDIRRVLEIRRSLSQSSVKKFDAYLVRTCADSRAKDLLMYHGGHTGRWSGKGIQPQNLPRGTFKSEWENCIDIVSTGDLDFIETVYGDPMGVFSTCVRGMISAPPGYDLMCADYSSIEAVALAWLAGERSILDATSAGRDLYIEAAVAIYKKPYADITGDERAIGKIAVLALGYQGGFRAFVGMATQYGLTFSTDFAKGIVKMWRKSHENITKFWSSTEHCAIYAVKHKPIGYRGIKWGKKGDFLYCKLPSGRLLAYYKPVVKTEKTHYGKLKQSLTYMGVHSKTKKWMRLDTYGGKLAENVTQAVARDLLAYAIPRVNEKYPVVLHVHDEILSEVPEGFGSLEDFISIMVKLPGWAEGLPLSADGWRGKRFRK